MAITPNGTNPHGDNPHGDNPHGDNPHGDNPQRRPFKPTNLFELSNHFKSLKPSQQMGIKQAAHRNARTFKTLKQNTQLGLTLSKLGSLSKNLDLNSV